MTKAKIKTIQVVEPVITLDTVLAMGEKELQAIEFAVVVMSIAPNILYTAKTSGYGNNTPSYRVGTEIPFYMYGRIGTASYTKAWSAQVVKLLARLDDVWRKEYANEEANHDELGLCRCVSIKLSDEYPWPQIMLLSTTEGMHPIIDEFQKHCSRMHPKTGEKVTQYWRPVAPYRDYNQAGATTLKGRLIKLTKAQRLVIDNKTLKAASETPEGRILLAYFDTLS